MTFKGVLAQIVDWLQQDGRISHRALKRQFDFDDDYLEDVKEALLYTHAKKLHDDGQGLTWTEEPSELSPNARPETDWEIKSQFERACTDLNVALLAQAYSNLTTVASYLSTADAGFKHLEVAKYVVDTARFACEFGLTPTTVKLEKLITEESWS